MSPFTEQDLEDLRKAGVLLSKIFKKILPQVQPGKRVADIVDSIEILVTRGGGELSFPPNLSVNTIAAHDTADVLDNRVLPEGPGYVKIDFGVAINDNLTDCARTVTLGDAPTDLIEASKAALDAAIAEVKPGVRVKVLGQAINTTMEERGFKPIRNLTGHEVAKGKLHTGVSIPNIPAAGVVGNKKLEEGSTYAIEPFATNGRAGVVEDQPGAYPLIFSIQRPPRSSHGKRLFEKFEYKPFSARAAARYLQIKPTMGLEKIIKVANKDDFHSYPPLWEVTDGMVAQSEDLVLVTKDGAEIITLGAYE